jgi:hypothetical protein
MVDGFTTTNRSIFNEKIKISAQTIRSNALREYSNEKNSPHAK